MKKRDLKKYELDPKLEIFGAFKFETMSSWSQIVLWCAINGFEADYEVFKFFMFGAVIYDDIYEMLLNSIKNTDILDNFINDISTLDILYEYSDTNAVLNSDIACKWLKIRRFENEVNITYDTICDTSELSVAKKCYKLFSAIDNKFPLLQIEFYRRHKTALQQFDPEFTRYIIERTRLKAKYNNIFLDIYHDMTNDKLNQQKTNAFLQ